MRPVSIAARVGVHAQPRRRVDAAQSQGLARHAQIAAPGEQHGQVVAEATGAQTKAQLEAWLSENGA